MWRSLSPKLASNAEWNVTQGLHNLYICSLLSFVYEMKLSNVLKPLRGIRLYSCGNRLFKSHFTFTMGKLRLFLFVDSKENNSRTWLCTNSDRLRHSGFTFGGLSLIFLTLCFQKLTLTECEVPNVLFRLLRSLQSCRLLRLLGALGLCLPSLLN